MEEKKIYHFGEKIRTIREKRGMTLKSVAVAAGVSESLVSQIERNKVSPAIDTLLSIATVLDIGLEYLFEEYSRQRPVSVIRKDQRRVIHEEEILFEEVSESHIGGELNELECYLMTVPAGSKTHRGNYGHLGTEVGFILEGTGRLHYGNKTYDLEAGDSVTFSAGSPHMLENTGNSDLKAMWTVTPAQKFN